MNRLKNLGLIEQLEISKLEMEELRNSKKTNDDLYDDEIKQFVRLLKEIRHEEQDQSNNTNKMIDNLTKSGSLLASALEGDENQYAFRELANLDRSALSERVQVFAKVGHSIGA